MNTQVNRRRVGVSLAAAALVATPLVALPQSAPDANAVEINQIEARFSEHAGTNSGPDGNCITYSPADGAWAGAGESAATAHGRSGSRCPSQLSFSGQSAIEFVPGDGSNISLGSPASLGTITHHNNPISASDEHFSGKLHVRVNGGTEFVFPWEMHETPNGIGNDPDRTTITTQASEETIEVDGQRYKMVITGFAPEGKTCDDATAVNEWVTDENSKTSASVCAQFVQVRTLDIKKAVNLPEGYDETKVPEFGFSSTSEGIGLDGVETFWGNDFSIAADGSTGPQDVLVPTQQVTVTENMVDGWELDSISCDDPNIEVNEATRSITFPSDEAETAAASCTFTNRPVDPVTVNKNVELGLDRTATWSIDKTAAASKVTVDPETGSASADYQVVVTEGEAVDSNWTMSGTIEVTNPNPTQSATVKVTDETSIEGAVCTVAEGEDAVVGAGETREFEYSCELPEQPSLEGTNTATVEWSHQSAPTTHEVTFSATDWTVRSITDETTVVSDTFSELEPQDLTWTEAGTQHVFDYTHEFVDDELPEVGECTTVTNTASLSTGGDATADVEVCAEAPMPTETDEPTETAEPTDEPTPAPTADPTVIPTDGGDDSEEEAGNNLPSTGAETGPLFGLAAAVLLLGAALTTIKRRNA